MSSTSKFSPMPTKPRSRPVERDFVGKAAKPPSPKTLRFRTGQGTVSKCGKLSQKSTQCPQIAVLTLIWDKAARVKFLVDSMPKRMPARRNQIVDIDASPCRSTYVWLAVHPGNRPG